MRAQLDAMHAVLLAPWPDGADRRRLGAALALALDFRAWQSLDDTGLGPEAAAALIAEMVAALGTASGS
jgi:hypothetical protein